MEVETDEPKIVLEKPFRGDFERLIEFAES